MPTDLRFNLGVFLPEEWMHEVVSDPQVAQAGQSESPCRHGC